VTLLLLLFVGCTRSEPGDDTGEASIWPPDPAVYDCRASGPPERIDPVPIGCALDRTCTTRLVSGHRGMGGTLGVIAPEDSVGSVLAAIAWGLDFVETDPRPTSDGHLVNNHDTSVDRTTTGSGEVDQMTLAEVQSLPMRADDYPGEWACARIPTLEEILAAARGRVHVLVDANKTDRVDLLVQAILDTGTLDWAVFDTSSTDKIEAALAIEPGLHTMIRVDSEGQLDAQLALFADHPPDIVEIDRTALFLAPTVSARGHKPLMDVFLEDAAAAYAGNLDEYVAAYDAGLVVAQSDRPDLVIEVLDRVPEPTAGRGKSERQ